MELRQYDRIKSALAEILRAAAMGREWEPEGEAARALFARLAEDRFNLVVVGRFSRGKTSLMNAMLGTDRLPTGIVPVTSVITTVSYGTEERVVLHYRHTRLFLDIPIAELAEHITEHGNPGNVRRIRVAEVQLPAELLRRGFYFIDTPGLGSSILENTRTTESFLPEADAFVLVTSYEGPLAEEESRVLESIHRSGRRVFVVVNKQDCVDEAARAEVLAHLEARLAAICGELAPRIYSLSARIGLKARLRGDAAALAASGLPELEAVLLDFLLNEKRREFLLGMCGRIAGVLENRRGVEAERARLAALREEITEVRPERVIVQRGAAIPPSVPECEVCTRVAGAVFSFLAGYQYRLHGDQQARAELAERRGLCGPHTWQFEAMAAPREICTGFASVAERQADCLRAVARSAPGGTPACEAIAAALPSAESCAACAVARRAAEEAVAAATARLRRGGDAALESLSAVCLPHLPFLVQAIGEAPLVERVLLRQADLLERLAEDMRHFALKRDGMQRHLTSKEEAIAGERGLRALMGNPRAETGPPARHVGPNVTPLTRRAG
jgi:GTP-binding protein EngB required for normal cell division